MAITNWQKHGITPTEIRPFIAHLKKNYLEEVEITTARRVRMNRAILPDYSLPESPLSRLIHLPGTSSSRVINLPGATVNLPQFGAGGTSTKAGNIALNWRKLLKAIGSGGITLLGSVGNPFALIISVVGAIMALQELLEATELPISPDEGLVMWVIHCIHYRQDHDLKGPLSFENILTQCGIAAAKFKSKVIDDVGLTQALDRLTQIGAIKPKGNTWLPVEMIRIK